MQAPSSSFPSTDSDAVDDLLNASTGTGRNTPSLTNPLSSLFPPVSSSAQYLDPYQSTTGLHHQIPSDLDALAAAFPEFDSATTTTNNLNHNSLHNPSLAQATTNNNNTDLNWFTPAANEQPAPAASLPTLDQFDEDLERALADLGPAQLNWLNTLDTLDFTTHQFSYHRGGTLSHPGGPLSAITASSESAYGAGGIADDRSESYYNPYSPQGSLVNAANPSQLNPSLYQALENFSADLAAFGLSDNGLGGNNPLLNGNTGIQPAQINPSTTSPNLHQLGAPNPIQPPSVNLDLLMPSSTASYSSFDDSGNSAREISPSDHLLNNSHHHRYTSGSGDDGAAAEMEREFGTSTNLLSAAAQFAQVPPQSAIDPRKKYQCPNCPRAFARAFNLKTHMATHDPNRLKPHTCHHPNCGRSFSRKHDLGRHLVSIHKDEAGLKMANSGGGSSASSTYGVSGHPLPHVNAHANAGRIHHVGSSSTATGGAPKGQKGSTTPTNAALKREH